MNRLQQYGFSCFLAFACSGREVRGSARPTQARYHCSAAWPNGTKTADSATATVAAPSELISTAQPHPFPRGSRAASAAPPECDAGFCVGPPACYPTTTSQGAISGTHPALVWEAKFDVPPLPPTFNSSTVLGFEQNGALEEAIGSHACSLEASKHATNEHASQGATF
jgi:hypothetical protein